MGAGRGAKARDASPSLQGEPVRRFGLSSNLGVTRESVVIWIEEIRVLSGSDGMGLG